MTKELSSQGGSSSALSTQSATWPRAPRPTIQHDRDRNHLTVRPRSPERTPGHGKGSPALVSASHTTTGMTHTCLGGFSKMCRVPPRRPKTTHRTMANAPPLGRTHRAREKKHSPYPSGPSAPRISRRSLWSSLQRDDTALSPRPRTSGRQQMHTCRCGPPGERAQSNTQGRGSGALAVKASGPPPRVLAASRGWGGSSGHAPCAPGTRVRVRAAGRAHLPAQPPPSLARCCNPTLSSFKERL